jgi:hypothetical protein
MIRIAITAAAYDAIAATLPLGSVGYEAKRSADGGYFIWLERRALHRLDALRQPGEGYSEVILRMARIEASRPGRRRVPAYLTKVARKLADGPRHLPPEVEHRPKRAPVAGRCLSSRP